VHTLAEHLCTYLHSRDPYRRADAGKDNVAWYFSDDIANCPTCLHIVQLVAIEPKILFPIAVSTNGSLVNDSYVHARHERAVDVRLVQVLDKVSYIRSAPVQLWHMKALTYQAKQK
jgi:hypothetical protein